MSKTASKHLYDWEQQHQTKEGTRRSCEAGGPFIREVVRDACHYYYNTARRPGDRLIAGPEESREHFDTLMNATYKILRYVASNPRHADDDLSIHQDTARTVVTD